MRYSIHPAILSLSLLILLGFGPMNSALAAESEGAREARFAQALLRQGYVALAEEVATEVENNTTYSKEARGSCAYVLADILQARANATGDAKLFEKHRSLLEELKRKYPNHMRSQVADLDQIMAMIRQARGLLNKARDEEEMQAKKLRTRAQGQFQKIMQRFDQTIDSLRAKVDEGEEDLWRKRNYAELLRADTAFAYAQAFEEDSSEQDEWYQKAHDYYEFYFNERFNFWPWWGLSRIGQGKCLIELGKYEDARWVFEEMTQFIPNTSLPKDPKDRAEAIRFVKERQLDAYHQLVRLLNLQKNHADALAWAEEAFARKNNGELLYGETPVKDFEAAKKLLFEKAKALAGLDRAHEGMEEIYERIVVPSRGSAEKIAGLEYDVSGLDAIKTMSRISEGKGLIFRAPVQYCIGQGFYYRHEFLEAAWAFKAVAVSAQSQDEREKFVPPALMLTGDCFLRLNRYLEAGITFRGLYRMFPESDKVAEAAEKALQSFKMANERNETPVLKEIVSRVKADAAAKGGALTASKTLFEDAQALEREQDYERAAEKYLRIKPKATNDEGEEIEVPLYGEAVANAGACYVKHFISDPEKNADALDEAKKVLREAINYCRKEGKKRGWATAAYHLGVLYNHEQVNNPAAAIQALSAFDNELSDEKIFVPRARLQQIKAYLSQGKYQEAEQTFDDLESVHPDASDTAVSAFFLADAFDRRAKKLAAEGTDVSGLRKKAGNYAQKWLAGSKNANLTSFNWGANVVYRARQWDEAVKLYQQLLKRWEPKMDQLSEDEKILVSLAAPTNLAWALYHAGRKDEAAKRFEALAQNEEYKREFRVLEGLAKSLYDQFEEGGTTDQKTLQKLDEAYNLYHYKLDQMGETAYREMKRRFNLPRAYQDELAVTTFRRLYVSFHQKRWGNVASTIDLMERSGDFDDIIYLKDGSNVVGRIKSESGGSVTLLVNGEEERTISGSDIKRIERYPADLRKRFLQLRERANQKLGR